MLLDATALNFSILLSFCGCHNSGSQMEPQCHRPPLASQQVQSEHWAHMKQGQSCSDPAQLFFTEVTSWVYSDTGTWKLFWATVGCCKTMRAKISMKKWCPMPHFPPCTYHVTSEEDGNAESKVFLPFHYSISELSMLLLLDLSFFPFFPCNFPPSKISHFPQILK